MDCHEAARLCAGEHGQCGVELCYGRRERGG
jgi:hypothetical protein